MKQNLENMFRESLENFELPYDASAWEAMNAKLDKQMPQSPQIASGFRTKRWWIAAAVVTVSLSAYWMMGTDQPRAKEAVTLSENDIQTERVGADKEMATTKGDALTTTISSSTDEKNGEVEVEKDFSNEKQVSNPGDKNAVQAVLEQKQYDNKGDLTNLNKNTPKPVKITIPHIADFCAGEKVLLENSNKQVLIVSTPSGKLISISPEKSYNLALLPEGEYRVGYFVNEDLQLEESFRIKAIPNADFSIDYENKYNEKGLPVVGLKALSGVKNYEWTVDKKELKADEREVNVNLYEKGNYPVTLTAQANNGCKASETKTIKVEEDYNLIAMDGFEPKSNDPKRNVFIPYALTKRDVRFTMMIYDMNGNMVFKTDDSNLPWDGTDMNTHSLVKMNATYLWKVVLENPQPGENPQYRGTVTVVE